MLWLLLYTSLFIGYMFLAITTFINIYDSNNSIDKTIIASLLWPLYWPFSFIYVLVYLYKQKKVKESRQTLRSLFTEEQLEEIRTRVL